MIKLKIVRYMTLYDLIKKIAKGKKYSNRTRFKTMDSNEIYTTDTIFEDYSCNKLSLNSVIEIIKEDDSDD